MAAKRAAKDGNMQRAKNRAPITNVQARKSVNAGARSKATTSSAARKRHSGIGSNDANSAKSKRPLAITHPDIALQWHPTKNGGLGPEDVVAGSNKKVWWQCPKGPDHEWEAVLSSRTGRGSGCPVCNAGWTVESIRSFVRSLKGHLAALTPAELYVLFQQSGMLGSQGKVEDSSMP